MLCSITWLLWMLKYVYFDITGPGLLGESSSLQLAQRDCDSYGVLQLGASLWKSCTTLMAFRLPETSTDRKVGNNDSTRSVGGVSCQPLWTLLRENWRRFLLHSGALLDDGWHSYVNVGRLTSYNYEVYLLTSFRSAKNLLQSVVFPIFLPLLCF